MHRERKGLIAFVLCVAALAVSQRSVADIRSIPLLPREDPRLLELTEVPPDYVKFDINLIRNIHLGNAGRQQTLQTLVRMVRELGIATLAEGTECAEEVEVCRQIGFDFAQGYYFGRPAPITDYPRD